MFFNRLIAGNLGPVPAVSPMTTHTTISLNDELLNTPKMTIADLIASTKVMLLLFNCAYIHLAYSSKYSSLNV